MTRIGIDLGTTNSLAALVYDDGPHVIPRGAGRIVPSVVAFDGPPEEKPPVVGEEADRDPAGAIRSVKRLMGRTWEEAEDQGSHRYFPPDGDLVRLVRRGVRDLGLDVELSPAERRIFWPHQISAEILKALRAHAEQGLGEAVASAVITVPAYFGSAHRKATLDAARAAGLDVAGGDLLDEPTAAALAFAPVVGFEPGEQILVVDWGGGTFDVTVLVSDGRSWMQTVVDGDLTLGGDDIDMALAAWALEAGGLPADVLREETNSWLLRREARVVKEQLSLGLEASLACPLLDPESGRRLPPLTLRVRRSDLEAQMAPLLGRVEAVLERSLASSAVDRGSLRKVLLAGGSSRIPAFQGLLKRLLPHAVLLDQVDPMRSVALGAALYANSRPAIAQISAFGYAVVDADDSLVTVIPPNSEVPTPEAAHSGVRAQTSYPGQTVYRLALVEFEEPKPGERTWGSRQHLFARGMPPTAGGTGVDVEIWLDEHKALQAQCHIAGVGQAFPMQGREEGPEELFTRLNGLILEGEALVEANPDEKKGLLPQIRALLADGRQAEEGRDRTRAEGLLKQLAELKELVAARQNTMLLNAMARDPERARVLGWVRFFEKDVLPKFWDAIPTSPRSTAVDAIRAVRVLEQTGAETPDLAARLQELRDALFGCEFGLPLEAFEWALTVGVPGRFAPLLRSGALRARDLRLAKKEDEYAVELGSLKGLLDEVLAIWRVWRETDRFLDASPDLLVKADSKMAGN
jgi:molecular chaperone DnaK (HSP70)